MILDLPAGRALHRFRRLNSIKQGHIAELLNVSQGTVSRWESGAHEPEIHHRERIFAMIAARANNDADAALRRLVCSSTMAVHLVCDATHTAGGIAIQGGKLGGARGRLHWKIAVAVCQSRNHDG
ncbi:helix-turn-helix domain-containing protein [Sphingomonas sp. Leaf205]|uniref:helix-turn-helix domain-containing protein n=1 Tax=Sphingomonas sp. Leaf205 TaxID=2876551 RepID=UPI001E4A8B12|nr:helix-turn-helix transcriptional regulator [Sphingomonas sp. Leaf205]